MDIGLDQYSLHHLHHLPGTNGTTLLSEVKRFGLAGLQFSSVRQLSPSFDMGELRAVRDDAIAAGLYLEGGIPAPNPLRPGPLAIRDGDGDLLLGLRRHLEALAEIVVGSRAMRCFVASPGDRLRAGTAWADHVEGTTATTRLLLPLLRDLDLKLAFETHADTTTHELIRLCEQTDPERVGICLDTGNLVITLEDPLEAARRAAPYTLATQIKDGIVVFGEDGLAFNPRALGDGIVALPEIVQELSRHNPTVKLSIEDHGRVFQIPIFRDEYLATFAELPAIELAHVVRFGHQCEQRIAAGALASVDEAEALPWADRVDDRIRRGTAYLRGVVREIVTQRDLAEGIARPM